MHMVFNNAQVSVFVELRLYSVIISKHILGAHCERKIYIAVLNMGQNTIIYAWRYKYMHYKMFKNNGLLIRNAFDLFIGISLIL